MSKIVNKLVTILCVSVLLVSAIGCAPKTTQPELEKQVATAQMGDLAITVSVDGNLVMPQAFDLRFGAPGNVEDVLVEEGDFVKEGTILATLDNTAQRLDVESANNNVQTVLSNLYQIVPLLPQFPSTIYEKVPQPSPLPILITTQHTDLYFPGDTIPGVVPPTTSTTVKTTVDGPPGSSIVTTTTTTTTTTLGPAVAGPIPGTQIQVTTVATTKTTYSYREEGVLPDTSYPSYYPNATAWASFVWARDEVSRARELFQAGSYAAASSELYVALSDLEACIQIFEDTINNPKSGLGGTAEFVPADLPGITYLQVLQGQSFAISYILELRKVVDLIKQGQADIETIRGLTAEGKYDEAGSMFDALLRRVDSIGKAVIKNVNAIKTHNYATVYGEDISLYFYDAAEEKLNAAQKGIESGDLNSPELHDNLRIARHYIEICNAILGSNFYVLQHGLSLQDEQQYKVDLAGALVSLGNKKDDFLKTIIIAPFDGIVVSVGVKKDDVLSAMDYSSKTAVQLVDTSQIEFQGLVDEIDILKIEAGQKAMISVDAVPNKQFAGTVSFISPYGTADTSNVVKFNVTILLDPSDVELKGSLTATADIGIYSAENVLLVPLSAVTTTPEGSFVTVVNEATGKTEKKKVVLGRQNYQLAEVLSGLQEGEKVIIEEKVVGAPVDTTPPGPPRR